MHVKLNSYLKKMKFEPSSCYWQKLQYARHKNQTQITFNIITFQQKCQHNIK